MSDKVAVIGGGMVGASIAYGLLGRGLDVVLIDGVDSDFRSATANFGLVWLHGKGMDMPAYQSLSRDAVANWRKFSSELEEVAGADLQYEQHGGLVLCLGEEALEERRTTLMRLHNQLGGEAADWEIIDRKGLEGLLPNVKLGAGVSGGSFGSRDGHANPLRLLSALQAAFLRKGGKLRGGAPVHAVEPAGEGGFTVRFGTEHVTADRIVIAAGLGSKALAAQVGLDIPIRPQRGQILVTERVEPFLPLPTMDIRQTREGTVMIGTTNEETGFDASTTTEAAATISANALRQIPGLGEARLVRQWAGLRIMTPDGYPIYAESDTHPGAFVALCHSGVTLAPVHAGMFSEAVANGRLPGTLDVFHQRRFNVSKAA
jgi:glycine/D-amino acid oxidase-like deaminating enzyme